ncbi:sensor histidine kinase [Ancrocorticia sp.]|uniref:sensor histidine kinase n=1 Tax=Ancrocorticia sp. TaxID=2593684 RepID=UPI003F8FFCDD
MARRKAGARRKVQWLMAVPVLIGAAGAGFLGVSIGLLLSGRVGSTFANLLVITVEVLLGPYIVWKTMQWTARKVTETIEPREPGEIAELTESRREIVAAFEIERRRIERDLHDGAQQYLVTASMAVGEADLILESGGRVEDARKLLGKAQDDGAAALRALRHTVAGVHPKVLSDLGLEAAVRDLAADSPLNVTVQVPHPLPEIPEGVVAAGYFMVAEALTNAAKYAPSASVSILLVADDDLHITVIDDGPGGAVVRPDHGLAGMKERLAAFGGRFSVMSPVGGPTTVSCQIPLLLRQGEFGVVIDEADRS